MLARYDWFFTRDYGENFTSKDIIEDDTLIFQLFRQRHRLTNDVFYFYLGEQGPELQAGVTLTSSGPPHPRKSVSRQEIHESKIKSSYLYRGKQGRPRARIRDRACLWLQGCRLPAESVSVHLWKKSDNDFTCNFCSRYTAEGKALYMVAALGVVMDTATC